MPFINVEVEESAIRAAKEAAARAGMTMKAWVERAVLVVAAAEKKEPVELQEKD